MDFALSPEEQAVADMVRQFTRRELMPLEQRVDEENHLPEEDYWRLRRMAAELGLLGADIPERCGGLGMGAVGLTTIREELGQTSFAMQLTSTNGGAKFLVAGSPTQQQKYLAPVIRGETICAFAITEPGAGSDVAAMETFAERDGDSWVLNGTKHFITYGALADIVIVIAVTDRQKRARGGISAFIVERGSPGFRVGSSTNMMCWRGVPHGELIFEDCRIPAENLLGEQGMGFKICMQFLDEGRLAVAAAAIGKAQRCLDLAIEYSKQRETFGARLAQRQAIQWMIADSLTELHAARLMLRHAARKVDRGERASVEASMCKLFTTEAAFRVADRAMQIHGAMGVMKELPIEMHFRDLRVLRIVEGASEIQRMMIARSVLGRSS